GSAPADGRVVHVEYGCGAHSEAEVDTSSSVPVAEVVYDDTTLDFEPRDAEGGCHPPERPKCPTRSTRPACVKPCSVLGKPHRLGFGRTPTRRRTCTSAGIGIGYSSSWHRTPRTLLRRRPFPVCWTLRSMRASCARPTRARH